MTRNSAQARTIREAIESSGHSYQDVAAELGISKSALAHALERPMSAATATRILSALGRLPAGHAVVDCPHGDWTGRRFALGAHLKHWHKDDPLTELLYEAAEITGPDELPEIEPTFLEGNHVVMDLCHYMETWAKSVLAAAQGGAGEGGS